MGSHQRYAHFIGIGGIGMSALAQILLERGWKVSGSDRSDSVLTRHLQSKGARIFYTHSEAHIDDPSLVVYSTAITPENPERQRAIEKQIPLIHRADLLKELMQGFLPLLVTGTHGKTTTTALLAHLLASADLSPSYAIGGIVPSLGGHSQQGTGQYFVAEADESDGSFLKYTPFGAIITNIDNDHLDHWKTESELIEGFRQFIHSTLSSQHLFWCGDDPSLRSVTSNGFSYGFHEVNDLHVFQYAPRGWGMQFDCTFQGKRYTHIEIPLAGQHQVLNAAAVFGLGICLGLSEEQIKTAFQSFQGVGRRLEKKGKMKAIELYDDYAHHPTEIQVTLNALKNAIGSRPLIVAFQPHRYTRLRDCLRLFGPVFQAADVLILTDIYAAGELPIEGITLNILHQEIQKHTTRPIHYVPRLQLAQFLREHLSLQSDGVLVSMGAGDITHLSSELVYERI